MYANVAYLDRSRDEFVDLSVPFLVTSCGNYRLDSGVFSTSRPGGRSDWQLLYVAEGKTHFYIDGRERILTRGNMILFRPQDVQLYEYYGQEAPDVCWVHFTGFDVGAILERCGISAGQKVFFAGTSPEYAGLYHRMIQELQLRRTNFRNLMELMLQQIFLLAGRCLREGRQTGNEALDEIQRATQYFHENYNRPISIRDYAAQRHMSQCWFIRSFRQVTKVTPMQYIVSLRITNARNLLDHTNYSVSRVAESVGYDNSLYFSRLFKKHVGLSPSEYRKKQKNEQP